MFIGSSVAGVYGILHDQVTYSISPEYYTKFKFYQFGLVTTGDEALLPDPRTYVTITGLMATWWTGCIVGLVQGMIGFIHPSPKIMLRVVLRTILLPLLTTFVFGIAGFIAGKYLISDPHWFFPENLLDRKNFITVGSIHNFSYLGGFAGLIWGIVYQLKQKRKNKMSAGTTPLP